MVTTADFLQAAQWSAYATLACGAIALLSFIFKWGIRFRFVGITGFMGVLTVGLFALGIVPFTRTVVPGAARFSTVYDTGSTQAVVTVPPDVNPDQIEATLRQAASDLYSPGRFSGGENRVTIRLRTIIHPTEGVSKPLYLGAAKRSLLDREDPNMEIILYPKNIAQLPPVPTEQPS